MFYKLCRTVWASTKAFTVGGSCWYGALDGVGFLQPLGSCSFWNPLLVPFLQPLFLLAVVPVPVLAGDCGPWLPVLVVASSQKGVPSGVLLPDCYRGVLSEILLSGGCCSCSCWSLWCSLVARNRLLVLTCSC